MPINMGDRPRRFNFKYTILFPYFIVFVLLYSTISAQTWQEVYFRSEILQTVNVSDSLQLSIYEIDLPAGSLAYAVKLEIFEDELPGTPGLLKKLNSKPEYQDYQTYESGQFDFFSTTIKPEINKVDSLLENYSKGFRWTKACKAVEFSAKNCPGSKFWLGVLSPVMNKELFIQLQVAAWVDEDLQMLGKSLNSYPIQNISNQTLHFQLSQDGYNWFSVQLAPMTAKDYFFSEARLALKMDDFQMEKELIYLYPHQNYTLLLLPNSNIIRISTFP